MSVTKFGSVAVLSTPNPTAAVTITDQNRDANSVSGLFKRPFMTGRKSYLIYPWGVNNLMPNEMIDLYRSNGDVMNLVQARIDFLYGAGSGWYKHTPDGKGGTKREPYQDAATKEFADANDLPAIINALVTYLCETGNVFPNLSRDQGSKFPLITVKDSLLCRAETATRGYVDNWILAPDWRTVLSGRSLVAVPAWTPDRRSAPETICQLKRAQTGQFYYGFAQWWAASEWIRLANRIAPFHNAGLDTEYNVTRICRVAARFFETYGGETKEEQEGFKDNFYKAVDTLLFGKEGKNRVLFDECEISVDGKLVPWIDIVPIEKSITGKEYTDLYQASVLAFANASGILAGLAGINDGKMLGGSGSELRVSAEYQQFYRTPRERQVIESFMNRVIKPDLKLPDDVSYGFENIQLETLDKNAAGKSQKTTSTTPPSGDKPADNNAA
jgi:hypothetical protein